MIRETWESWETWEDSENAATYERDCIYVCSAGWDVNEMTNNFKCVMFNYELVRFRGNKLIF